VLGKGGGYGSGLGDGWGVDERSSHLVIIKANTHSKP
jgi:hypothetical protein